MPRAELNLDADERALAWLQEHGASAWAIDYEVHRCCGGGKICNVVVRENDGKRRRDGYVPADLPDGTRFLVDPRASHRLPSRVTLTVGGIGPRKHLDLELSGEEWGELLYT
jgi:hypothetical protein